MLRADHPILQWCDAAGSVQPLRILKEMAGAHVVYPIAEALERRAVRPKLAELRRHYARPWPERQCLVQERLHRTLLHAKAKVPYYRDLFTALAFDPDMVLRDIRHLQALPILTKSIILEQGERLLSRPLAEGRVHACKTGGSTGRSCVIYYDQHAADYAAAVTLFCRERIGKTRRMTETHFACRFPTDPVAQWPTRETAKQWAMNRSNIFFDRLDDAGVEGILMLLRRRRPHLIHAHPSTIHAVARYVRDRGRPARYFRVFESSGELLDEHVRRTIEHVLRCRVVNRYGLAEFGIMAYQFEPNGSALEVLDSEGFAESRPLDGSEEERDRELIFTGFRNGLMPLIRYRSGDRGTVETSPGGIRVSNLLGRIHDLVHLQGVAYPTHHIQDVLDHRVGGIEEFQVDLRSARPVLRIVSQSHEDQPRIREAVAQSWPEAFTVEFVGHGELVRVGRRGKFRHVIPA